MFFMAGSTHLNKIVRISPVFPVGVGPLDTPSRATFNTYFRHTLNSTKPIVKTPVSHGLTFPGIMRFAFLHYSIFRWGMTRLKSVLSTNGSKVFSIRLLMKHSRTRFAAKMSFRPLIPRRQGGVFIFTLVTNRFHKNIIAQMQGASNE